MRHRLTAILLAAFFVFWGSTPAQAYLLPPDYILEYMIKNRDKFTGIEVVQTFSDGKRQGKETFYLRKPSEFRVEGNYQGIKQIWVNQGAQTVVVTDGLLTQEGRFDSLALKDLFVAEKGSDLLRRLEQFGVDSHKVALGRQGAKLFYIIGADEKNATAPQVWIEKDSFLPGKVILKETVEGAPTKVEVRYEDFGRSVPSWYPGTMQVFFNDVQVATIKSEKGSLRADLSDQLFSVQDAKKKFPPAPGGAKALSASRITDTLAVLKKN